MASLGILSDPSIPLPFLLDAINHAEVGHLTRAQASDPVASRSPDNAYGHYQFLQKMLMTRQIKMMLIRTMLKKMFSTIKFQI